MFAQDGTGTLIKVDILSANNIGPILHPGHEYVCEILLYCQQCLF